MAKSKIFISSAFASLLCVLLISVFFVGCGSTTFEFDGSITKVELAYDTTYKYSQTLTVKVPYDKKITKISYTIKILDKNQKAIEEKKVSYFFTKDEDMEKYILGDNYVFNHNSAVNYTVGGMPTFIEVTNFQAESNASSIFAILGGVFGGLIAVGLITYFIIIKVKERKNSDTPLEY